MPTGLINRPASMLLVFLTVCTVLTAVSVEDIHQQMINKYNSIDRYEARFYQYNHWEVQDIELRSEGVIYISGDRMAVLFSQPAGQKMVVDEALYLIDESEKTILITDVAQTGGGYKPTDIINLYWNQSAVELQSESETEYKLKLYPYDDPYTAELEIGISKRNFLIVSVSYRDHQNNVVSFDFFDERINRPIDEQVFSIPQDENYTIIDNRN